MQAFICVTLSLVGLTAFVGIIIHMFTKDNIND